MKKLNNILLYSAIVLSGLWIIMLSLGMFEVFNLYKVAGTNFNYWWAFAIVIVCMLLYIGFLFIEKIKNLDIPAWFKNLFYVAFFVFTNVYYLFGLYHTIAGIVIFDICFAALINILAVSLFYNTQKDAKNAVKTTDKFLVFSCFCYSSAAILIYQLIVGICKCFAKKLIITNIAALFVTEISTMLCVTFVFAIIFTLSMRGSRRLVNNCLIKYLNTKK